MPKIITKRVYEPAKRGDGYRVLVDRLWPRGVSKDEAGLDEWLKEVAPSTELRKWFHEDPDRWSEFRERYLEELDGNPALDRLTAIVGEHERVTLLYSSRDEEHNHASILGELVGHEAPLSCESTV